MQNTNLSEQIRKLRLSKKMTLAVMAERLGITTSTVAAYENGSRNPSHDVLVKIARIFNVTVDNLLGYTEKDYIDVSELVPKQRDNIESLISLYRKYNALIMNRLGLDWKKNSWAINEWFESDADAFIEMLATLKKIDIEAEDLDKEEIRNLKEKSKTNSVKDLEDRIKILEEMIKNNKSNDT